MSFVWTFFLDKHASFHVLYTVLLGMLVLVSFTISQLVKTKFLYAWPIIIANLCMSGLFGMIPNAAKSVFGDGLSAQLYGLIYMGQILTVISSQFLLALLKGPNSYFTIMYVNGALGVAGLAILWFLFEEKRLTIKL
jgi:Zn-dependent protease with chaperone function